MMEPLPILRFCFVDLGFWGPGSVGVEAEGLIKADVGVGRGEKEAMLSQLSPTAISFLAVVGLLFQSVNCFMS